MKTKLYGWLIAFFSLVLLHPSGLLAEGAVASANSTPKTAEELLVSIRDFLANPDMDGVAFMEKITGVSKADWGPVRLRHTGLPQDPHVRWEEYEGSRLKQPSLVPYRIYRFKIEEHKQRLLDVEIVPYQRWPDSGDPEYLIELTPEVIRRVLGPPNELSVTSPTQDFHLGRYSLYYNYFCGRHQLSIIFLAKGDNDRQLRSERSHHSTEQIQPEIARRKLFENHKDFLATNIRLTKEK